jgi:hypothetical protein
VSVPRKIIAGLLTAGLMALAMWLYTFKPHLEAKEETPLVSNGHIGSTVDNPDFSVKVGKIDVATGIAKPSFLQEKSPIMRSPGIFVIVHLEIKSNQKPFRPGDPKLITRGGVSYGESGRPAISTLSNGDYQPMLWAPAAYVFEIPKDRLPGTRLVIGESALLNQLSAETEVDLGIDDGEAAQLLAHASPTYALKTT